MVWYQGIVLNMKIKLPSTDPCFESVSLTIAYHMLHGKNKEIFLEKNHFRRSEFNNYSEFEITDSKNIEGFHVVQFKIGSNYYWTTNWTVVSQ